MKKRMKTKPRILGLFLFLLGCLLAAGQTWAANGPAALVVGSTTSGTSSTHRGAVVVGTATNISGGQADNLYFGTYQQSSDGSGGYLADPIQWRVLENADGKLFLLSDQNLDVFQYNVANVNVTWATSTIRSWLNGYDASHNIGTGYAGIDYTSDNFISTAFSEGEQAAIAETNVVTADNGYVDGGEDTTDKIFLLSIAEAQNSSFFSDNSSRIATNTAYVAGGGTLDGYMNGVGEANSWWLRSLGNFAENVAYVTEGGSVYSYGGSVDNYDVAVRPAFHLDLNAVLFTSAAAGGKPEGGLQEVSEYDGNQWKLTLKDGSRSFSVTETTASGYIGNTVTLHYAGATTGTNEYISALLTDELGNALYYGRVAQPSSADGEVSVAIPASLAAGTYTLNVFSEQYNGDYHTDYASEFAAVSLTVYATPGQIDGVYQIKTADELFWFAALVNGTREGLSQNAACAVLTTNIDLTGEDWTPIGSSTTPYTGTFDGQGYTISGMKIENGSTNYQGFVGYLGTGTIQNLTLGEGCSVTGGTYSGGICGWNNEGTITGCTNEGSVYSSSEDVGGICGHNMGTVQDCTNTGNVTGTAKTVGGICGYSKTDLTSCINSGTVTGPTYVGGICGYTDDGAITNCRNSGTVTGSSEDVGGICGFSNMPITNCANTGSVNGGSNVGGVCGLMVSSRVTIDNCYSTGTVTGSNAGGIYGKNGRGQSGDGTGTITNCYYQSEETTSAQEGVIPKTAAQFESGEVAYLLQGSQTELVWGQAIGTDEYPVLTADEAKKVYTYNIYNGSDAAEAGYANSGASISLEGNAVAVVEAAGFTPADGDANVIVKDGDTYTCGSLVLTDGADFYTPVAFTAGEATYSRTLPSTSTWGTIVLPFAATEVSGASLYQADGVVVSDGSDESILAVLTTDANILEANTPALFKGETGAEVSFSASGAEVSATADAGLTKAIGDSGYTLTGSMSTITLATGDLFISKDMFWSVGTQNTVGMQAFRAYIDAPASSPANVMRIMVGSTTDIRQALADGSRLVDVYSLQGILLRKGVESSKALNGLPAGVYVVGGKKVKL